MEVLKAQQRESAVALTRTPAMSQSLAGKDEADKVKVIAELRTKCVQLEAERDRYKKLMEIQATKYATERAELAVKAAREVAMATAAAQKQQQQQQQTGEGEKKEGEKKEGEEKEEGEGEK